VDSYRTEEEQVEALRRWWDENGKSVIAGIIIALGVSGGWQYWQSYSKSQAESASSLYQDMLQNASGVELSDEQRSRALDTAEALKSGFGNSAYAQFAALHMARLAVEVGELEVAEAELRWILTDSRPGPDVKAVTQQRLARILAARGEGDQALAMLESADSPYATSYAMSRGDILMQMGRTDEARLAYEQARLLAATADRPLNLAQLEQKLQVLSPVPARELPAAASNEG
jgi:predicted negative regulator of RcsB-dependent stress response